MTTIEINRENYVRYSEASLKAAIYMYKHNLIETQESK